MKKLLALILFLSLCIKIFCQDSTQRVSSKEYYLNKSKEEKTTGWVLLCIGTPLIIGGRLIANEGGLDQAGTGGIAILLGGIAVTGSVISFINSGVHKKRAAEIAITDQKIYFLQKSYVDIKYAPGITIKIKF